MWMHRWHALRWSEPESQVGKAEGFPGPVWVNQVPNGVPSLARQVASRFVVIAALGSNVPVLEAHGALPVAVRVLIARRLTSRG